MTYFNMKLASDPRNWIIVAIFMTIWLLAFHVIMGGFKTMQAGASTTKQAPGQSAAGPPLPTVGTGYQGTFAGATST